MSNNFPVPPLRWAVAPSPPEELVTALARGLTVSPALASLLVQRGLSQPEEARRFLRPMLEELANPLTIAGMAEAYYATIAPHNPLGPISLAAGIQIAASIPNFLCQEHRSLGEGYVKQPFVVRDGYVDVPTGPELGIELDEQALAGKIGHSWKSTESYDEDDGSVVDW